ncbi:MAG: hypothetical protein LBL81_01265 [Tannerella sp.]|nr:hypothetical protein [Tannerella sp.]
MKKFTAFPSLGEHREKIHNLPRTPGSIVKKFTAFPSLGEHREKIHGLPQPEGGEANSQLMRKFVALFEKREI